MNTLTNKDKLALQVSLALVAGMFSMVPVAHGAPVLDRVVTSGTQVHQTTANVTAVMPAAPAQGQTVSNNVVNWKDFSVGQAEKVVFDAADAAGSSYTKTNNYLNVVTGNGTSFVDGQMQGGNNVYLVNPNGIIMGANAKVDVGNLYLSTKDSVDVDKLAANNTALSGTGVLVGTEQAEVVNMGKIQANSVYAEGTNIRFLNTADVQYKDVKDVTDTTNTDLSPIGSSTATAGGGVTLKGTGYVHVGYEATDYTKNTVADYKNNLNTTKTPTALGYTITSSATYPSHDYALVHNTNKGQELQNMNNNKSLNYMLAENIILDSNATFKPIGDGTAPFTGNFDGNFYEVRNMVTDIPPSDDYVGLFGKIVGGSSQKSSIMNVGVVDAELMAKAGGYVGGIAGYIENVRLENAYSKGNNGYITSMQAGSFSVNTGSYNYYDSHSGGLVGYAKDSTIENVYNAGLVINGAGLVGELINSKVRNAYNAGRVENQDDYVKVKVNNVDKAELEQHHAIADVIDNSSTVENVYGSGDYQKTDKSKTTTSANTVPLAPNTANFTNAYVIDNSSQMIVTAIGDKSSANYLNNNNKYNTTNASGMSSDNYGFFSTTTTSGGKHVASTKSDDGAWRIYDGHTLPLLRSFLKANGNGTVPVSFDYALYADNNAKTPETTTLNGSNADGTVTYNGYYIGVKNVTTDSVRNLDPNKIKPAGDKRAKNVGGELTAFYSTGQDGYDLASDSLKIVERKLAPSASRTDINKIYDGDSKAAAAINDKIFEKIDLRQYSTDPGYGIVEVYKADGTLDHTDNVSLAPGFIDENNTVYVNGPNVTTQSPITLAFGSAYTGSTNAKKSGLTGTDAGNYSLTSADFQNVKLSGDITQREVLVSLNQSTGIDKTYDSTSQIVDTKGAATKYLANNVKVEAVDTTNKKGIVSGDKVSVTAADAYYSTDGTAAKKVTDANTTANAYKAAYALAVTGDAAKIGNYKIVAKDNTVNFSNNILMGTGTINKRNVSLSNIDYLDSTGKSVTNTKIYDATSDYTEADHVGFTAASVATVQDAVSQTKTEGVLQKDAAAFNNLALVKTGTNAPAFYNGNTSTATSTSDVADAKYVKYTLQVPTAGNSGVLKNYTLNGQDISGGTVTDYRQGQIKKRPVTVSMLTATGIDKTYDATKDIVDRNSVGYLGFKGTKASVNGVASSGTTTKGYVGYGTGNKLVKDDFSGRDDSVGLSIKAEYTVNAAQGTAITANAADVYMPSNVEAKKIKYTVELTGKNAANYDLNGTNSTVATLDAAGTINPRKITGITFADVSKKYDGTAKVGTVNGVTQASNTIKVTGVAIDTFDNPNVNSSGLLGNDTFDAVLGTTKGVIPNTSTSITALYGNLSGTTFTQDPHAHATNGSATGATRQVQYTGVNSLTSSNHNYTTAGMNNVQYGSGRIDPLTIDTITTSGTGKIEKVYDGTKNVVGGVQVNYTVGSSVNPGDIVSVAKNTITSNDVKTALGNVTASGKDATGQSISVNMSSYKLYTGKTQYDNLHVNDVKNINFAVDIDDGNGDYVLAANGTGYTKDTSLGNGGAYISKGNVGSIKARVLKTKGVTGLGKTYDGTADVKNASSTVLKGDSVVTIAAKDDISGLVGTDGVTNASEALYSGDTRSGFAAKDANVYTDGSQTTASGAKEVTYTVKLSDGNAHGDYVIYKDTNNDGLYAPGDTYTLDGNNITQADLTVSFGNIQKDYDTNAYVKNHKDSKGNVTQVTLSSGTPNASLNGLAPADTVNLVTQDTSAFLANGSIKAEDVGSHTVQYDLVSSDPDLKNYRLVGSNGSALSFQKNGNTYKVTAYGKGDINTRTIGSLSAIIDRISKVYDGNTSLTYNHTAGQGYDFNQQGSSTGADVNKLLKSVTLGTITITSGISIDTAGSAYTSAAAGSGNKGVTYSVKLDKSIMGNYNMAAGLGTLNADGSFTFKKTTNNNTITQKNVYATLNSNGKAADPTKEYDGGTVLLNKATDGNATVDAAKAKTYVDIKGLVNGDNAYTVTAAYDSKDVAVDAAGNVATNANVVNYTVGGVSNNYKLFTDDGAGNISSTNMVLKGLGTIRPKGLTLSATKAEKVYDTLSDIDMASGAGVTQVPTFTLNGTVGSDSITLATSGANAIKGDYGNYANGTFTADPNVAFDASGQVDDKAVRYGNVHGAFIAGNANTKLTNYTLASGNDHIYNTATDELIFTKDKGKGRITKLAVNNITADINPASKVYDGKATIAYNHTAADGYDNTQLGQASAASFVNDIALGNVVKLNYGYTVDEKASKFDSANAGTNKKATYELTIDSTVIKNLDLNGGNGTIDNNGNYNFKQDTTGNSITAKNVYATLSAAGTAANPTREYDGTTDVFNNATKDNGAVVDTAKAKTYVTVSGLVGNDTYEVKKAAYNDKDVLKANAIDYNVGLVAGSGSSTSNYLLHDAAGKTKTDNTADLTGKGTITPRGLTLDTNIATKTYDKNANVNMTAAESGDVAPIFKLSNVVNGEQVNLDSKKITGLYGNYDDKTGTFTPDANVALDSNNQATYKAVRYSNVGSSMTAGNNATDLSNYQLVNYKDAHLYNAATDELTFLAAKQKGLINKRAVSGVGAALDANVNKVYDGKTSLTYDHTDANLEYDFDQNKDKHKASDYVHGVTVTTGKFGTEAVTPYTVVGADYDTADAGKNKDITYKMMLGVDFARNYDFTPVAGSMSGTYDNKGNFTFEKKTSGNSITPKNIYTTMNSTGLNANPTKEYDGTRNVLGLAVDAADDILVDQAKAKTYFDVTGLVGNDTYQVDAAYNNKDVIVDKDGAVQDGAHKIDYTVGVASSNYVLHDANGTASQGNKVSMAGKGTIIPRSITLDATLAQKTYDQKADVKTTATETGDQVPVFSITTGVTGESISLNAGDIKGVYGDYDADGFKADANVALDANNDATYKAVQYSNVGKFLKAGANTDLKNYTLTGNSDQIYDKDHDQLIFTADKEKGLITKRGVNKIVAEIDKATKVYDGNTAVSYNHTEVQGYHESQWHSAKAEDFIKKGITLKTDGLGDVTAEYGVADANYDSAKVEDNKNVTYNLVLGKDFARNYDLSGLENGGKGYEKGSFYFNEETTGNSITPKNVYASLTGSYNPTKVYDGSPEVLGKARINGKGSLIDQAVANGFVSIEGMLKGEDSFTVTPTYQSKNVAVDDEGQALTAKNGINYVISGVSDNYALYTKDASGKESNAPNDTLVGEGTITQKGLTLTVGYAEKAYDAKADVNLEKVDTSIDSDKYPTFEVSGEIEGENLNVAIAGDKAIKGSYGIYNAADKSFTEDGNVAFKAGSTSYDDSNVTFKDVQYSKVQASLTGEEEGTLGTNYKIAKTEGSYNADDDTLTFTADQEKGKITRRTITGTKTQWSGEVVKEYDGTNALVGKNVTDGFKILGVSKAGDKEIDVPIGYNLVEAGYGYAEAYDDKAVGIKDVGKNLPVYYKIDGLSDESLKNFKLADGYTSESYHRYFTRDDKAGTITQRVISGKASKELQEKIYDGNAGAKVVAEDGTPYFAIDEDDLAVINLDRENGELVSTVNVKAAYTDKNANISPEAKAEGGKVINYTMAWADAKDKANKNYIFADGNGGKTADYQGQGDIRQRKVYLKDQGGKVLSKEYDGRKVLSKDTDLSDRFVLEGRNDEDASGIIDAGVGLNYSAIRGEYDTKNVARDKSGNVINKDVTFKKFELEDSKTADGNDAGNYALAIKDGSSSDGSINYAVTDEGIEITEKEGGRIDPKNITVAIRKSPTKQYDQDKLVKGEYEDEDGNKVSYASASNLTAAADGAKVSRSFGNANNMTLSLDPGSGETESFDVTLTETPTYDDENVSRKNGKVQKDKATFYKLSWNNSNYDLAGNFTADGTNGYTSGSGKTRTGVLQDNGGEITPYIISVKSIDSSKTYDGTRFDKNPTVKAEFALDEAGTAFVNQDMINRNMAGSGNIQDFLGLTAGKATYGAPTEAALNQAKKDASISEEDIAEAALKDAAFNKTSAPFQHQVAYNSLALGNGNYELDKDYFDNGTGTINRATVTAHGSSATITAGNGMPSFTGYLEGFVPGESVTKMEQVTTKNEDGTTETKTVLRNVPLAEYYGDAEHIYWGPATGVNDYSVGKNPVYGWYRISREEMAYNEDGTPMIDEYGNQVYNQYWELSNKEINLDKNYVLAQDPGEFTVLPSYSGGGSSSGSSSSPAIPSRPSSATTAAPVSNPEPVVPVYTDLGYVEKPVVPDSSVYKSISKDISNAAVHDAAAAIQYGKNGSGLVSGSKNGSSASSIDIEVAEVVNLLGEDVASDGSMSLSNTDSGEKLSVKSTEEGYLSVGTEGRDGSIGIETEERNLAAGSADKEGRIGIESEENAPGAEAGDKEGSIGLETEDGTLLDTEAEAKVENEEDLLDKEKEESERSAGQNSSGQEGKAEIVSDDGSLKVSGNGQVEDEEEDEEEDKEDEEESESREGEAAIAYNDVA